MYYWALGQSKKERKKEMEIERKEVNLKRKKDRKMEE